MDSGLPAAATSYIAAIITETGGAWPPTAQNLVEVTPTKPLKLTPPSASSSSPGGVVGFSYAVLAPALGGTPWAILGELNKVVPVLACCPLLSCSDHSSLPIWFCAALEQDPEAESTEYYVWDTPMFLLRAQFAWVSILHPDRSRCHQPASATSRQAARR